MKKFKFKVKEAKSITYVYGSNLSYFQSFNYIPKTSTNLRTLKTGSTTPDLYSFSKMKLQPSFAVGAEIGIEITPYFAFEFALKNDFFIIQF